MPAITSSIGGQTIKGFFAACLAAGSFSSSITAASFAYGTGTNPITVIAFRAVLGLISAGLICILLRRRVSLPPETVRPFLLTTLGIMMVNYGYIWAVQLIPVSLATLVFYTFPFIVLCEHAFSARRVPSPGAMFAFALAFGGLALALGPALGDLDWRGVAAALVASIGGALTMIYGGAAARGSSILVLTFYAHLILAPIALVVLFVLGGPIPPGETPGWIALVISGGGYLGGLAFQFVALRFINASSAAMVFNMEPLITIILATLVLGEILGIFQYVGGGLVIAAIILATRYLMATSQK